MSNETPGADARFYVTMAVIAALLIFAGFAPSFYLKPILQAPPPLSSLTITHGVIFTAWVVLFVVQSTLIAQGRNALHRQLGMLGAILFGCVITLGFSTAITAGSLGHAPPESPPPLTFMALPLIALAGAALLAIAAFWNRRRSDWHKRQMISALFMMTGPGTARIGIPLGYAANSVAISMVGAEILLALAMAYDYRAHQRVHAAYWWAAGVFAATHAAVVWAFSSPAWLAFAQALTAG